MLSLEVITLRLLGTMQVSVYLPVTDEPKIKNNNSIWNLIIAMYIPQYTYSIKKKINFTHRVIYVGAVCVPTYIPHYIL